MVFKSNSSARLTLVQRKQKLLISYDTQAVATLKARYIVEKGLGGAMFWELDADKPEHTGGAIVRTVREQLGDLEWRENELKYTGSSKLPLSVKWARN